MNCLEFRRELFAGPRHLSGAARQHLEGCSACAEAAKLAQDADRRIEEALLVAIPEGLEERVLLRRGLRVQRRWEIRAMAASVILAVAVAAGLALDTRYGVDGTASHALAHVSMEPESFQNASSLDPAAFQAAIRQLGGEGDVELGRLRYVRLCPMEEGGRGWHFVFESGKDLLTVFVVPDGRVEGRLQATTSGGTALVRAVPKGYFAVVAASEGEASRFLALIQQRIRWQT